MMKYEIFLASSIVEFKSYRNGIGDFIRRVQDIFIDYHIRLKLFECEFHDNSIGMGRKQEEYNEKIRNSDVFLMLVGKKIGEFTLEEYRIAKESNTSKIYILFEEVESDKSVLILKEELDEKVTTYYFKEEKELNFYIGKIIEELKIPNINIKVKEDGLYIENICVKW